MLPTNSLQAISLCAQSLRDTKSIRNSLENRGSTVLRISYGRMLILRKALLTFVCRTAANSQRSQGTGSRYKSRPAGAQTDIHAARGCILKNSYGRFGDTEIMRNQAAPEVKFALAREAYKFRGYGKGARGIPMRLLHHPGYYEREENP